MRLLAACLVLFLLLGCQSQPAPQTATPAATTESAKHYPLRGIVLEIHKDKRELRIQHEDIPGYMKGMTMNFPVRDDAALATLAPGDQITADLVVAAPGEYWLANIKKGGK